MIRMLQGDCRVTLATLESGSVQSCITSPPYYGLRDYGTPPLVWGGIEHEHDWTNVRWYAAQGNAASSAAAFTEAGPENAKRLKDARWHDNNTCQCGAWQGSLGLEPTPDCGKAASNSGRCGACFVCHLVECFREVKRVLRNDGTLWVNMGDSYAGSGKWPSNSVQGEASQIGPSARKARGMNNLESTPSAWIPVGSGYKPKDLMMMPFRVALALQQDGWYLRSVIPWLKRNCLSGGTSVYVRSQKGDMRMTVKDMARLDPSTLQLWNGTRWTQVKAMWRTDPSKNGRQEASDRRRAARYRGQVVEVPTYYEIELRSGERFGCTAEHRWPTGRGVLPASELQSGDILCRARLPEPEQPVAPVGLPDQDVGWFVGMYIAEGCRDRSTIHISGHVKEVARGERLARIADAYQGTCVRRSYKGLGVTDNLSGPVLHAILDQYVAGEGAKSKHLTGATWQRSDEFLRALLLGYLEGDGHNDERNRRWRLGFCQNDALAEDLRTICARLGVALRLKRGWTAPYKGARRPMWRGELRFEAHRSVPEKGHFTITEGEEIIAIRASRGRAFWDIEVEDDPHVFALGSGILTHNSMPESVVDRPSTSVEYVFLMSKNARYFWDAEAIRKVSTGQKGSAVDFARDTKDRVIPSQSVAQHRADRQPTSDNGTRSRRNGDWFIESWQGLMLDEQDDPLALIVNPAGFSGAHFATFPTKLVEPMVKASTSEKGQCPECGAPWIRIVETSGGSGKSWHDHQGDLELGQRDAERTAELAWRSGTYKRESSGWDPSCAHTAEPVPQIILDPFGGAGTVGLVADRLGRNAVLCELKESYAEMGTDRLVGDAPLFVEMDGSSGQPTDTVDKSKGTPRNDGSRWNQNNGRGF